MPSATLSNPFYFFLGIFLSQTFSTLPRWFTPPPPSLVSVENPVSYSTEEIEATQCDSWTPSIPHPLSVIPPTSLLQTLKKSLLLFDLWADLFIPWESLCLSYLLTLIFHLPTWYHPLMIKSPNLLHCFQVLHPSAPAVTSAFSQQSKTVLN